MKLTTLAVVILALGIVLGLALAGGASEGPASAAPQCPGPSSQCPTPTPAPPQQREDQIALTTDTNFLQDTTTFAVAAPFDRIALDPADYPSNAVFRLEAVVWGSSSTMCLRLFDWTTFVTVPDSEVCASNLPASNQSPPLRIRSGPFSLPAVEADYGLMGQLADGGSGTHSSLIIVEWTE